MTTDLEALLIRRILRVPRPEGEPGDGSAAARQFDAALMSAGFKCSRALLEHLSGLGTGAVMDTAVRVLAVVREMVGDHVQHNSYFRDFPHGVPDTVEFWARCLAEAIADPETADQVEVILGRHPASGFDITGSINLLSLPSYGRYQHSYAEMLAAHDELIRSAGDRVTVLHLGGPLAAELHAEYLALARNPGPLDQHSLAELRLLAAQCAGGPQPEKIPVRENRAVINGARLAIGAPLLVDTVTDVLRLAAVLSGGDAGLREPARLAPLSRARRRALLAALDGVVARNRSKLGDVPRYAERWKRLGERLHPGEYPQWPHAQEVFAVARGDLKVSGLAGRVEARLARHDLPGAVTLLASAPGLLLRSVDRLLRLSAAPGAGTEVVKAAGEAAGQASGRVVLSLREHFQNRGTRSDVARLFVNRDARAWVRPGLRDPLDPGLLADLLAILDTEIAGRLPGPGRLVVDPAVLPVALPLSSKTAPAGLGVLPRGSLSEVDAEILRFFVYWRQKARRTDYDLSALMLDENYGSPQHVSWTNLATGYAYYSGDITSPPPEGATEFIDIQLGQVPRRFVIPQVLVFAGEGFSDVAETFFGFMTRATEQLGAPFEPRTVRAKSGLGGSGRIALPVAFARGEDGRWRAKWLHLYQQGRPSFNQVEGVHLTTSLLVRSVMERDYLKVGYLAGLLRAKAAPPAGGSEDDPGPVTYLGLEQPEDLPAGSRAYTLTNLAELIPD